jgi:hypothetical protein
VLPVRLEAISLAVAMQGTGGLGLSSMHYQPNLDSTIWFEVCWQSHRVHKDQAPPPPPGRAALGGGASERPPPPARFKTKHKSSPRAHVPFHWNFPRREAPLLAH